MRKFLLIFLNFFFCCAFAIDNVKVTALEDFSSIMPSEKFKVEVCEDAEVQDIYLFKGDILDCELEKIKDPTRAKRDAKIFFKINTYEDAKGIHDINPPLIAKYAKRVISKEEIKKIPPKNIIKRVGGAVGDCFATGVSYGISFIDGVVTNNEENRLKSGIKQVYDDSFVSLIEYGEQVNIIKGDIFYFVVKKSKSASDED